MKLFSLSKAATLSADCSHAQNSGRLRVLFSFQRSVAFVSCVALMLVVITGAVHRTSNPVELDLFTVAPRDFRMLMDVTGRVEPIRSERVSSECQWSTRILSLIPEGTWVQKGDVVCVLDASEVEEYVRTREVPLIKSRATLDASVQDELLLKSANDRRLSGATFDMKSAALELEQYQNGTHPQQMNRFEQEIYLSHEQLQLAEEEFSQILDLSSQGFTSDRAVAQARFELQKKKEAFRRQQGDRELLTRFTHPRNSMEYEFRKTNAEREVLRTEVANSLAETRAKLTTLSNERRMLIYQRIVANGRRSIEACTMRAPCDGQVIYTNSWNDLSRGQRTVEEGKPVYFQQPIFEIPDTSVYKVTVSVHESLITRIYRGMPVTVRLKGYEQQEIAGEIRHISNYPQPRSRYSPTVLDYQLDVSLNPSDSQKEILRLNMDATVTLTMSDCENALTIPKEAIVSSAGLNFVWVMEDKDIVPRAVQPGDSNDSVVRILDGLSEGDRVATSLTPQQRAALENHLYEQLSERNL